jgi:acetyltransferase-like isoleucine patch superfamily enzyme
MPLPSLLHLVDNGAAVARAQWHLRSAERLGARVRLWGNPQITNSGRLLVGERVRLVSTIATLEIAVGPEGLLEIGDSVFINYGCSLGVTKSIKIGKNCSIGTHVIMMDNDFHRMEPERRNERPESRPIVLEDNVWLGARAIVLRGVTIGEGSVVGAGSVVTRDVPPRSVAAGVPAKVVKAL